MENLIEVNDLVFRYKDHLIFDHFSFQVPKGSWVTIMGENGGGKSTLVRILAGLLKTDSSIKINGLLLKKENLATIRKKMGVVLEQPDNQFITDTVRDEIVFVLENLELSKTEIKKRLKEICDSFDLTSLLDMDPRQLSGGQKQLVILASVLVMKPDLLLMDEALSMLDMDQKNKVISLLKCYQEGGMTILSTTQDVEDCLLGNDIALLQKGKLILYGPVNEIVQEETLFASVGLQLPFMADLSIKLQYYGLLDHVILDMDKMVDTLWKL